MAAADPVSGAGRLALHVHCSFSRQRMRLPETTNNCPPVIETADFINRQKKKLFHTHHHGYWQQCPTFPH